MVLGNFLANTSSTVLITVSTLLPIVNPFSTAALFMSLSTGLSQKEKNRQAYKACVYMSFILTFFLIAGAVIMNFFGISVAGIRIAGGLIIMVVGFRMLFPNERQLSAEEEKEVRGMSDIALVPLAMPSLSGPGSIAVVLSVSSEIKNWYGYIPVALGILLTALISFLVLKGAATLTKFLGVNGVNIFTRIMGFLLICIAVQFLASGVFDFIENEPHFKKVASSQITAEAVSFGEGDYLFYSASR
jgi:multiple antibiotic resistance protein